MDTAEQAVCKVIEDALGLKAGSVKADGGSDTIKEWDSLGFLAILAALEKMYGSAVAAIDDLASVRSVKEIVVVLKRERII